MVIDKLSRINRFLRILLFGIGGFGLITLLFKIPNMIPIIFVIVCTWFIGTLLNLLYEDWRGYNHD